MPLKCCDICARRHIPQLDRVIIRSPEARVVPSGENDTDWTLISYALEVLRYLCVSPHPTTSPCNQKTRKRGLCHPVNTTLNGQNAYTPQVLRYFRCVSTSHNFTVPSEDAEARVVPSGENDTDWTLIRMPLKCSDILCLSPHPTTSPCRSHDAEARVVPSGENATEKSGHSYALEV